MWSREIKGVALTFHLAGINNQNFLMRDEETGTFWQQISGRAVSGPLAGSQLKLIPSDELTFALWRTEQPQGTVLKEAAQYSAEYAAPDWDIKMRKAKVVISHEENGRKPRDLMLGVHLHGKPRAYLYDQILKQKLIQDAPLILVVGPDNQSVRVFETAAPTDFYRTDNAELIDSATGSHWNFQGCATEGKLKGTCLPRVEALKDYWFDWKEYNPNTSVY